VIKIWSATVETDLSRCRGEQGSCLGEHARRHSRAADRPVPAGPAPASAELRPPDV